MCTKCAVIGSSGGIDAALAIELEHGGRYVMRVARGALLALELIDETSIATAAAQVGPNLGLVVDAPGFLHDSRYAPEKGLKDISPAHVAYSFAINVIEPALLMTHFLPQLAKDQRAVFVTLSARVGSISDNHLGGAGIATARLKRRSTSWLEPRL